MAELKKFLIRRLLTFVPTLIGATFIVFVIAVMIPGNPAQLWAGGIKASKQTVELLIKEYHLNSPWYVQYYYFMKNILSGKAISPVTNTNIWHSITTRLLQVTLPLTLFSFILIVAIGIPLGIVSAIKRNTWIDNVARAFALIGISTPIFWIAYILIFWLQPHGLVSLAGMPLPKYKITGVPPIDALLKCDCHYLLVFVKRMWLPAFLLALAGIGVITRVTRNSFLDAMSSEYVVFMEARGFPKRRIYMHVLKNSLTPVITVLGLMFGGLLAGAPITETIFGLPGLGRYMLQAIYNFDYLTMITSVFFVAMIYITVNLLVDILYGIIDPRVRY